MISTVIVGPCCRFVISLSLHSSEDVGFRERFVIGVSKRCVTETRGVCRDIEGVRIGARYARQSQCQVSGCARHNREAYDNFRIASGPRIVPYGLPGSRSVGNSYPACRKSENPEYVWYIEDAVELGVNRIAVVIKKKMLLIGPTRSAAYCWCAIGREMDSSKRD